MAPTRVTPIHILTCALPDGTTRRYVVPGEYCDGLNAERRCQARRPTWTILTSTWRGDYRYIDHPAGQANYQPGLHHDLPTSA